MAITDYDANKDLNVRIDGVQIDVGDSWELSFAIRTIMADLAGSTLDALAGLATTDGNIIVGNGSTWVAESGATARTSLGLGTGDSPEFTALGLGISAPDGTLHAHTGTAGAVTASGDADDLVVENAGNAGISILSPDANNGIIRFGTPTDATGARVLWDYTNSKMALGTTIAGAELVFTTANGSERLTIDSTGNVGVGITAPDVELDVAGAIGITDGVTAPSTVSGKAFIYVDTADGDLKVKFGDGTVKTLATDT